MRRSFLMILLFARCLSGRNCEKSVRPTTLHALESTCGWPVLGAHPREAATASSSHHETTNAPTRILAACRRVLQAEGPRGRGREEPRSSPLAGE